MRCDWLGERLFKHSVIDSDSNQSEREDCLRVECGDYAANTSKRFIRSKISLGVLRAPSGFLSFS